ncbi:hypothetical protein [Pseudoalteromonas piscicida]|nr:hypothetical protein [Pseudoalteromonas piscicida]
MSLQKWGGIAALTEAATYLFGFVLFLGFWTQVSTIRQRFI